MLDRKLSGRPPATKVPPGAVDTQTHMYLPNYPAAPSSVPLPPNPPGPDEYRQVMRWLGTERVVITQGNAHGKDNSNLLACLTEIGQVARGVAVVDQSTTKKELARLSDAGIVGARIMDLPGGAVGLDQLEAIDEMAFEMGWCIAVQFNGSTILSHETRLHAIRSRWILDHHGKFLSGVSPNGPEIDALKRLLDGGRCWFKFSGCYESSLIGGPAYEDVGAVARVVGAYAPERMIWGTNWPHNSVKTTADYPDEAELLDLAMSWLPNEEARHQCLVDNPAELFFRD